MSGIALSGEYEYRFREGRRWGPWRRLSNGLTTAGLTDFLAAGVAQGTQRTWYLGLISATNFTDLSSGDTMSSHTGWAELTAYSGNRKAWGPSVASALAANSTPAEFSFNDTCTVQGFFVASDSAKGGSSGVLLSTAELNAPRAKLSGQSLQLRYRLRAAGGSQ